MSEVTKPSPEERRRPFAGRSAPAVAALLLAVSFLATGCGNVTAGGLGETTVILSGDAEGSEGGTSSVAPATDSSVEWEASFTAQPIPGAGRGVEGTVSVRFRVSLLTDNGFPVDLTRGEQEVVVDASGEVEEEIVSVELRRTIFRRARVVFTHVSAEVVRVPGSDPVTVEVDLASEGGEITVERPIFLLVEDRGRQELLVDLSAGSWVPLQNVAPPAVEIVAANVFRSAVRITVRQPD